MCTRLLLRPVLRQRRKRIRRQQQKRDSHGRLLPAPMLPSARLALNILFASETEDAGIWLPLLRQRAAAGPVLRFAERKTSTSRWSRRRRAGTFEPLKRLKLVQSLWMGVERLLADPAFPKGVPLARLVDPGHGGGDVRDRARARARLAPPSLLLPRRSRTSGAGTGSSSTSPPTAPSGCSAWASSAATSRASSARSASTSWAGAAGRRSSPASRASPTSTRCSREATSWSACCRSPRRPAASSTARTLRKIRLGGAVINVARGGHLVAEDLIAVLDSGHLAHAYLDVFEHEPLHARPPAVDAPRHHHHAAHRRAHRAAHRDPEDRRERRAPAPRRAAAQPGRLRRRLLKSGSEP